LLAANTSAGAPNFSERRLGEVLGICRAGTGRVSVRSLYLKLVQDLLGHSTIAITLDTYSHVLLGMGDALADTMDEAFG
jgi:integrase